VTRRCARGWRPTTDGALHEADVLVWGTGFAATRFLDGIRVVGVAGAELHDRAWAEGAWAHLGVAVPGFPHLFCIYGPNTNLGGSSIITMMEAQAEYVATVTAEVGRRRAAGDAVLLEVRHDVALGRDDEVQARLADSAWPECDSWYKDGDRTPPTGPARWWSTSSAWPRWTGPHCSRSATDDTRRPPCPGGRLVSLLNTWWS